MSATSSRLRRPRPARPRHRCRACDGRGSLRRPSNGRSQAMPGASQSGVPTVAPVPRSSSRGALHGRGVEHGLRGIGDQDEDVLHGGSKALICKLAKRCLIARHGDGPSSSSPDRPPPASRRWRSPSPSARRHGDQRRCHADLRCLPDPDGAADGRGTRAGAACALWRAAAQRDACRRRAGATLAVGRDRALPGGRPHADPVRRLGPLPAHPDAGHSPPFPTCPPDIRDRPMPTGTRWAPTPSARAWPNAIPAIVARLKPGDRQRHVRAWEVRGGDRPAAQRLAGGHRREPAPWRFATILLAPERAWLRDRDRDALRCRCWRKACWPRSARCSTGSPIPRWPGLKAHGAPELFPPLPRRAAARRRASDRHRSHPPICQTPDDVVPASDDTRSCGRPCSQPNRMEAAAQFLDKIGV